MHSAQVNPAADQPHTAPIANKASGHASITLARGKAITLRAAQARVLRVQQGRVWATLAGAAHKPGSDHVLVPGSCLPVPAGASVVVEHWALPDAGVAELDWQPAQARVVSPPRVALGFEPALSARAGLGAWLCYNFASILRT